MSTAESALGSSSGIRYDSPMPKVAVGSKNPTKINAVKRAFAKVFPDKEWRIIGVDVSSGVSNQPKSATATIRGATNRATNALKVEKADYSVGLEGGMQNIEGVWFETGWAIVQDTQGTKGIGSSIHMRVPAALISLIEEGHELGSATDEVFKRKNSKKQEGFFGLMSNGNISRTSAYADAVISALTTFLHPNLF